MCVQRTSYCRGADPQVGVEDLEFANRFELVLLQTQAERKGLDVKEGQQRENKRVSVEMVLIAFIA